MWTALEDHNIVALSVVPEKTDHSKVCVLTIDTKFVVTRESEAHSNVQFTLVELTNKGGHEGGTIT